MPEPPCEIRPRRIRLSRRKGWRMPDGAVKIDRSTRYGNPFRVGADGTDAECQALYRRLLEEGVQADARADPEAQRRAREAALAGMARLRGRDLGCWCALCARHAEGRPPGEACAECAPCHGDVLLELANR